MGTSTATRTKAAAKAAARKAPRATRTKEIATESTMDRAASKARPRAASRRGTAADENWDVRLGFLMHDVSRLRRAVFDEFMRPLGVTRSQWWVLAYLSRHDGMIQSDLASALDLGKAALGGLIDRLEASGFIVRRTDEVDRRAKRVFLAPPGTQMVKEMNVRSHEMSEWILQGLSSDERYQLADMLSRVKKKLLALKRDMGSASGDEG